MYFFFQEKTPSTSQSSQESKTFKDPDSWPHLKYDFVQPNKIRDLELRKKDHENYDPRTIHVPNDFLNNQTPVFFLYIFFPSFYKILNVFFKDLHFFPLKYLFCFFFEKQI